MYTGTMIDELIATVARAECWAEPTEIEHADELEMPVACLLEQCYEEQLVEVA
jgi:hypothetical protein